MRRFCLSFRPLIWYQKCWADFDEILALIAKNENSRVYIIVVIDRKKKENKKENMMRMKIKNKFPKK